MICGDFRYELELRSKPKVDGLWLIKAANVYRRAIDIKDLIFADPGDIVYDRDPVLKENELVVVRSGAYTAPGALIPKTSEGSIAGFDIVFGANSIDAKFVGDCFLSHYVLRCGLNPQSLSAAQPQLHREELNETITFPREAGSPGDYLDSATSKNRSPGSSAVKEL